MNTLQVLDNLGKHRQVDYRDCSVSGLDIVLNCSGKVGGRTPNSFKTPVSSIGHEQLPNEVCSSGPYARDSVV